MKFIAALTGICLLFLCSCQKEIDPINIVARVDSLSTANDSTTLVKYVDLDTTLPSGLDTSWVQTYKYDSLKRIVQADYIEYLNSGLPQRTNRTLLFYNGSDTVPYKKTDAETYVQSNTPSGYTAVAYYTYASGRIVKDSVHITQTLSTDSFSRTFAYSGNSIIETTYRYIPALVTTGHNISFVKSGSNLTSQNDTVTPGSMAQRFSFAYDNKPNPLYHKPQPFISDAAPYYTMETLPEEMVYEANNPVEINEYSGTLNYHVKIAYKYKPNGYPLSATFTDVSSTNPQGFLYKRLFFYTKL